MGEGGQTGEQARSNPRDPPWTHPGMSPDAKAPDGMTSRLPLKLLATPGGRGLGSGARLSGPVLCIPT